jgi:pimeloyl-ACP methyl ester carboxylesterase
MKAELPIAELVIIKRGGHMALMEQNQLFAQAVSAFCSACGN